MTKFVNVLVTNIQKGTAKNGRKYYTVTIQSDEGEDLLLWLWGNFSVIENIKINGYADITVDQRGDFLHVIEAEYVMLNEETPEPRKEPEPPEEEPEFVKEVEEVKPAKKAIDPPKPARTAKTAIKKKPFVKKEKTWDWYRDMAESEKNAYIVREAAAKVVAEVIKSDPQAASYTIEDLVKQAQRWEEFFKTGK